MRYFPCGGSRLSDIAARWVQYLHPKRFASAYVTRWLGLELLR